jgi:hypothetical protein
MRKAFRKADKFDHFRQRTRRAFLGVGALALALGGAAGFAGRGWWGQKPTSPAAGSIAALATGSLDQLRANYQMLLAAIETGKATPAHWHGYERLVLLALSGIEGVPSTLATDLLLTASVQPPPEATQPLLRTLAQRTKR